MPEDGAHLASIAIRRMDMGEAKLRQSLFRSRGPLSLGIADTTASLWYLGEACAPAAKSTIRLRCHIGEHGCCLILPVQMLEDVLRIADANLNLHALDHDLLPAILLGLLGADFERAETALGCGLDLAPWQEDTPVAGPTLLFRCDLRNRTYHFQLVPESSSLLERLTQILASLPHARRALPEVHAPLILSLGSAILPLREIERLKPGDVIIPTAPPLAADKAYAVLSDRWLAEAHLDATDLTLTTPLRDTRQALMETNGMSKLTSGDQVEDTTLGELPLKLTFEIGRLDLPVGELQGLAPGYVFNLARTPGQWVDICVSGRRIGTGELVQIGEQLGVRLTRLGQHG